MAKKVKLTRPELKKHRDALARFERYLPMLKLKQQQLQLTIRQVNAALREALAAHELAQAAFAPYRHLLADTAGVDVNAMAEPEDVTTATENIAGVNIPVYEDVVFPPVTYSLFGTAAWVDRALADMREITRCRVRREVLQQQRELLQLELTKIIQRVNLFEKVKIPEAQNAIRLIQIKLGDEMTAAVGRGKIAKGKLVSAAHDSGATSGTLDPEPTEGAA
jgi:V/A-type H+/Na+-transporting ATPase subunit D